MPGWVFPALKAILPHVGTIIEATKPVFSRRAPGERPSAEELTAELQAAVTQNADHIKALAEQLRKTVTVLEAEARVVERRLRRMYAACLGAAVLSVIAVALAVAAYVGR